MGKKQLQKEIRTKGAYIISTATLNPHHLLATAYDLMSDFNLRTPLKKEILEAYGYVNERPLNNSLVDAVYYGRELEVDDEMVSYLWEDVCNYFDDIAPSGYSFRSAEGNGSDIGWFKGSGF